MEGLPRAPHLLAIDYLLAALIYTTLARFFLGIFVPLEWNNFIWQFFRRVTDPVLAAARWVTPPLVLDAFLPLVAIWWLFMLRILINGLLDPIYRANILITLHLLGLIPASWLGVGG